MGLAVIGISWSQQVKLGGRLQQIAKADMTVSVYAQVAEQFTVVCLIWLPTWSK